MFSTLSNLIAGNNPQTIDAGTDNPSDDNSQTVPLLTSSVNFNTLAAVGGGNIATVGDEALISEDGPSGTYADSANSTSTGQIISYMVQPGDTIFSIAHMFGVSVNTILWANTTVTAQTLKPGQILVILPVSGTMHMVASGDTLASIANEYHSDPDEIMQFNDLTPGEPLTVGQSLIIPNGEGSSEGGPVPSDIHSDDPYYNPYRGGSGPDDVGYYIRPLVGGVKTQGLHGYNAIDIGTPVGTPILAAAAGQIIVARSSGWNGGYGEYVEITHPNNTQTLYAHLSKVYVTVGQEVKQGQVIALSGDTGLSTGPHLHFEVHGAVNPLGP